MHWLWFALGGRLPERYRDWVWRDATTRWWVVRYATRVLVRTAPLLVAGYFLLALLPIPPWQIVFVLLFALAFVLYMTLTSAGEFRRVWLAQHHLRLRR